MNYYCNECKFEICNKCKDFHINHENEIKSIDNNNDDILNEENFKNFLEKAEKIKKSKYEFVENNIKTINQTFNEDELSKNKLNGNITKIIKILQNDLKINENLLILAVILFMSSKKIKKNKKSIIESYKIILNIISSFFEEEEIQK